jgi:hypothetical protein
MEINQFALCNCTVCTIGAQKLHYVLAGWGSEGDNSISSAFVISTSVDYSWSTMASSVALGDTLARFRRQLTDLARVDTGEANECGLADVGRGQKGGKLVAGWMQQAISYRIQFHVGRYSYVGLKVLTRDKWALSVPMDFCLN